MGAEQVGYLVKGPAKIQARQVAAAVRACQRQRKALLKGATSDDSDESLDPQDIPVNPIKEIRVFVDWWASTDGRDTCSRTDPDDPRQKLVYAGEMSWGDEPDGAGFQMLKRAFAWGFAEALGVR